MSTEAHKALPYIDPNGDGRDGHRCSCDPDHLFSWGSELSRHIERKNLELRFPEWFSVGPTGEGPLSAWAFVLAARSRGWLVSDPANNGHGSWYATVWRKGADDNDLDATGVPDDMKVLD